MSVLERTELPDALIRLTGLIVAAWSEEHGGSRCLDHARETRIGLIQKSAKTRAQSVPKCKTQCLFVGVFERPVQVLDRDPDLFKLAITAQIRGTGAPKSGQRVGGGSRIKCSQNGFEVLGPGFHEHLGRGDAIASSLTSDVVENKVVAFDLRHLSQQPQM